MEAHLLNILWISGVAGLFGGIINFFQLDETESSQRIFYKSIIIGVGASYVVPLFLQTISSDLINQCKTDGKYYFIYAGFCIIAAIFSRRFLKTVADAVIQKAENAEKKANQAIEKVNINEEKVSAIVEKNSEPENEIEITDEDFQLLNEDVKGKVTVDVRNVINVFKTSKYTYRTSKGIAKDISTDEMVVEIILEELETAGIIKKYPSKDKILWTLTEKGNLLK